MAETERIIIGIDPGKKGGVVVLKPGGLVYGIPAEDYTIGKDYHEADMARTIRLHTDGRFMPLAILERQHAMPGNAATSTLSTGIGYGLWRGILGALGIPFLLVSARVWQKEMFQGMTKDNTKHMASLVCARQLPQLDLQPGRRRTDHDGLADAACMALYGRRL